MDEVLFRPGVIGVVWKPRAKDAVQELPTRSGRSVTASPRCRRGVGLSW